MASTSVSKAAFSRFGKAPQVAVDVDSASDRLSYKVLSFPVVMSTAAGQTPTAIFTQNATNKHSLGPLGIPGIVRAVYASYTQLPAGGTLTTKLVAYDASANAEIDLTDTADPEAATVREGQSHAMATTNVALAADDTLEFHCAADNSAVGTVAQGLRVTVVFQPTEASPPTITSGTGV